MSDILLLFLSDDKPNNTLFLAVINIFYLVLLWGVSSASFILFSLYVVAGFWFFTSISIYLRFRNKIKLNSNPILHGGEKGNSETRILISAYIKSVIIFLLSVLIILFIIFFSGNESNLLESGIKNVSNLFINQYYPSNLEFIIISILWILSIIFPYYFFKWIIISYLTEKQEDGQSHSLNINSKSIVYIFLVTFIYFIVSFSLNLFYIDSKANPSALIGLESIIQYSLLFLIIQIGILILMISYLRFTRPIKVNKLVN